MMSNLTITDKKEEKTMKHSDLARKYFEQGYNCSQSVVLAYCDKIGIDEKTAAMMSSTFGGGMGRMREVCGAVSGMFTVLGLLYGYSDPKDANAKKELYADVRSLGAKFADKKGSIICRELLGIRKGEEDTKGHDMRCVDFVTLACDLLDEYIEEKK